MTKDQAYKKIEKANSLIFEVEEVMNIQKSHVRRIGYQARIAIQSFKDAIRQNLIENLKDL